MITTPDLLALAGSIGVSLTEHQGGRKGLYLHQPRLISVRADLSERAYRSTLAHELGHAHYRDEPTGVAWLNARMEARADQFAARLLINDEAYAAAEHLHGPHDDALAHELGVTRHVLATWRGLHERKTA